MNPALLLIGASFVVALALGVRARRGHPMTLEQWSVGGRGFGTVLVFVLMAGEIYTTFTFLGGSGWAYGKGAPAFYILCYGALAYGMSYFLLPAVWRYAKTHALVSQADFFERKYDSRSLGILVSVVSVAAMVPYLVLQLKGLGIIVSEASNGVISAAAAVWMGSVVLVIYVVASGVRGSAWTAVLKDALILIIAVFLGTYLPVHVHGGYQAMFSRLHAAHPGLLTLPATGMSPAWFISTVVLTSLGFYMWPHTFGSCYTARNERVFRRNAVLMPLYQLVLLFVFFTGFAALLEVPGLTGTAVDLSLLRVTEHAFGPWMLGAVGAAGLLTALVPGSMLLMSACTILSNNVYAKLVPGTSEARVTWIAKALVPVLALLCVLLTFRGGDTLVVLLLMAYNVVTQLFPALILSLTRTPFATRGSAIAGIVAGELAVMVLTLTGATMSSLFPSWPRVITDLNVGIVAMAVNIAVMVAWLVMRRFVAGRLLAGPTHHDGRRTSPDNSDRQRPPQC